MANLLFKANPGLITAPHWMCAVALLGGEESQEGSGGGEAGFWVKFLLPSLSNLTDADRPIKLSGGNFCEKYMDVCA